MACNTAWCSILLVIILVTFKSRTQLLRIKLSASVPPEVKIISAADTLKIDAISFRQFSNIDFEDLPIACVEDGLPYSLKASETSSTTSSLTLVVAALSK